MARDWDVWAKNSAFETKLKAKEWQWELGREAKSLDKEIAKIQKDEAKLQEQIRLQAQKGNVEAVQLLARSVVKTRNAVQRLEKTKASMEAVKLQLTTHMASISTSQSIRLSSDIMKKMNAIARIPEVSAVMKDMREQMAMCADAEDSIEDALRDDGEEREAAFQVQKVLEEMALDQMGPLARGAAVPVEPAKAAAAPAPEPEKPQKQAVAIGEAEDDFVKVKPAALPPPAPEKPAAAAPPEVIPPAGYGGATAAPAVPPAVEPAPAPAPGGNADDDLLRRLEMLSGSADPAAPATAPTPGGSADDDLMRRLEMLKKP